MKRTTTFLGKRVSLFNTADQSPEPQARATVVFERIRIELVAYQRGYGGPVSEAMIFKGRDYLMSVNTARRTRYDMTLIQSIAQLEELLMDCFKALGMTLGYDVEE